MKFLHLADLHLGKYFCGLSMLPDQQYILQEIIHIIDEEKPDGGIILAGDIYDRPVPPAEAVALFNDFLNELYQRKHRVFLVSGNHDSGERLDFVKNLLKTNQFYFSGSFYESMKYGLKPVKLADDKGPIYVYLLPFVRPSQVRGVFKDKKIESYEDGVRQCIAQMLDGEPEDGRRRLIIGHQFVTAGHELPVLSDSEQPVSVGLLEAVDASVFAAFDYAALGHIHRPQKIGRKTVRYAGAMLAYSFSEAGQEKSVTVIEFKEKGNTEIRLRPLQPKHPVRILEGTLEELLLQGISDVHREDYLSFILTDKEKVFDAFGKLKKVYPNALKLQVTKSGGTSGEKEAQDVCQCKKLSPEEMFVSFYQNVTGQAPDNEETQVIRQIMEKAKELR